MDCIVYGVIKSWTWLSDSLSCLGILRNPYDSLRQVYLPNSKMKKRKMKKGFLSCPSGIWLRPNSTGNCFGTTIHLLPLSYTVDIKFILKCWISGHESLPLYSTHTFTSLLISSLSKANLNFVFILRLSHFWSSMACTASNTQLQSWEHTVMLGARGSWVIISQNLLCILR